MDTPTDTPVDTPTDTPAVTSAPAPAPVVNPYPVPGGVLRMSAATRRVASDAVRWLQTELVLAGYPMEVDGIFGRITSASLIDFQKRSGLVVDGICGPLTIQQLLAD